MWPGIFAEGTVMGFLRSRNGGRNKTGNAVFVRYLARELLDGGGMTLE